MIKHSLMTALVVATVGMIVSLMAYSLGGMDSLTAAVYAAAVCLMGSIFSRASTSLIRGQNLAIARMAAGTIIRLSFPLAMAMKLMSQNRVLADAGLGIYLVIFYMVILAMETRFAIAAIEAEDIAAREASSSKETSVHG